MNLYLLDSKRNEIAVIDGFISLIWTKRYYECGDFELQIPASEEMLTMIQPDCFIVRDDDESVMVVERIAARTDLENGDTILVSGRSLESILERRICLNSAKVNASDVVQGLKELVVSQTGEGDPTAYRSFPNFVIDDSLSVAKTLVTQFTGDTLLSAVSEICTQYKIGFKIIFSGSDMVLSFYSGSAVEATFSPEFDNMVNSDYVKDFSNLANYAYVYGEGSGEQGIVVTMSKFTPNARGLSLRELYVDAKDIDSSDGNVYLQMLLERGRQKLAQHDIAESFEAEVEPLTTFQYKRDYNLGDIVSVINEYGVTAKPRIVEIIESWDETGYTMIPTFDSLEIAGKLILKDSSGKILKDSTGAILTVKE